MHVLNKYGHVRRQCQETRDSEIYMISRSENNDATEKRKGQLMPPSIPKVKKYEEKNRKKKGKRRKRKRCPSSVGHEINATRTAQPRNSTVERRNRNAGRTACGGNATDGKEQDRFSEAFSSAAAAPTLWRSANNLRRSVDGGRRLVVVFLIVVYDFVID